jgi:hypothetical protein
MNQAVISFATTTARDAALPSPSEGQLVWLEDSNKYVYYTGSAWSDLITPASSGNAIINGAFDIWQRGTTFSSSGFTADRWAFDLAGGTGSVTQQTFTPGTAPVAGYEGTYFLRKSMTTGAQYSSILQRIEDVRSFAGQTVTVSFWAKGTNPTGNFYVNMLQNFGTGGSTQVGIGDQTLTVTSSWVRYTMTFVVPSVSGKTIGTGSNLWLTFYQAASNTSVSTLDLWGVQVESGSTATAFKRNASNIQGELAACQRYYFRKAGASTYPASPVGFGAGVTSTLAAPYIQFPVQMRDLPTSVDYSSLVLSDQANANITVTGVGISTNQGGLTGAVMDISASSGITVYRPYVLRTSSSSGFIGFSAEL